MTFKKWKAAILLDGWFTSASPYLKATRVVHNAYVSHRMGQLSAAGLASALRWAYNLDEKGAYFEHRRNEMKKLSTVV